MTTDRQETEVVLTTLGESLQEAGRPKGSLVTLKFTAMIGNWNVRTMYTTGAAAHVAKEMKEYKIHILGISECGWIGAGRTRLETGKTVLHADGSQRERGQLGDPKRPGDGQ